MTQQSGTQQDLIQTILQDSGHHRSLFDDDAIERLQSRVFDKTVKGKKTAFVRCILRNKDVQLKPDEVVRQLYADRLINHYGYPHKRLTFEHSFNLGRQKKKADIVIFDKDKPDTEFMIIELKRPKLLDGKNQLRSYCNATGAPIGVWTNGQQISRYHRKDPNYFEELPDIPSEAQSLEEIISERFTLKDLYLRDKLVNERKSLKEIILELEDEVLANAGVDVFEEVFKLIFTKLFDEIQGGKDRECLDRYVARPSGDKAIDYETRKQIVATIDDSQFRSMEFRNTGQTDAELKRKIQALFNHAKKQWPGVFSDNAEFELSDNHLAVCVASLQDVKLFNSNLIVIDEAFEYLVNKSSRGEKGLYFTPRHVIDMCVKMLNPKKGEHMIDTAAGSCGFPVHTIFWLTGQFFNNVEISKEDKEHVLRVFGIEFDEKTVRVARTLNLIAGAGQSNVLHLNTLDYERWSDRTEKDRRWISTYDRGFARLEELRAEPDQNKSFNFDILMANPPFAGDIKESRLLPPVRPRFQRCWQTATPSRPRHPLHRAQSRLSQTGRTHGDRIASGPLQRHLRQARPRLHRRACPHSRRHRPARQHLQAPHRYQGKRTLRAKVERRPATRLILSPCRRLPDLLCRQREGRQGQLRRLYLHQKRRRPIHAGQEQPHDRRPRPAQSGR